MVMEENGASIVITNDEVGNSLYEKISKLIDNPATLIAMSKSAKLLGKTDAAEQSAKKIVELAEQIKSKTQSF
ncbi:MAG: hypothetical protein HZB41_04315 [Ignavibacteriae bacterium]|nr:hypothetical protein [Ignavibacteriota bacterium]